MSDYRRWYCPGGTYFLTAVTQDRKYVFHTPENIQFLRDAISDVMSELPFRIEAAVILPDHAHFLWSLPDGDSDFSKRIGKIKTAFTKSLGGIANWPSESSQRQQRFESGIWQRRCWEHLIRDDKDFERHLDYIHYNPVKHGYCKCPHEWEYSSFGKWVRLGQYAGDWGCSCRGNYFDSRYMDAIAETVGE